MERDIQIPQKISRDDPIPIYGHFTAKVVAKRDGWEKKFAVIESGYHEEWENVKQYFLDDIAERVGEGNEYEVQDMKWSCGMGLDMGESDCYPSI